jgi:hypothetical protein
MISPPIMSTTRAWPSAALGPVLLLPERFCCTYDAEPLGDGSSELSQRVAGGRRAHHRGRGTPRTSRSGATLSSRRDGPKATFRLPGGCSLGKAKMQWPCSMPGRSVALWRACRGTSFSCRCLAQRGRWLSCHSGCSQAKNLLATVTPEPRWAGKTWRCAGKGPCASGIAAAGLNCLPGRACAGQCILSILMRRMARRP